jgi:guanylate kinase
LKSQVERQLEEQNILFDVDVKGGCNLKKYYGERALFIFVQAPSIEVLRERLVRRGDTVPEEIERRVSKAEYEMTFAKFADRVIVNDNLETAKSDVLAVVEKFLNGED